MISSDTKLLARDLVVSIGWDLVYQFGNPFKQLANILEAYRLHFQDKDCNHAFWAVLASGGNSWYGWEKNPEF
jgi:hypothetical protein